MSKICTRCGECKPVDAFSKDKRSKDGLQSKCKACNAAYQACNRELISARMAAWYAENRSEISIKNAAYRSANREVIAASKSAYYAKNSEKITAKAAAWRKANPDRRRETNAAWVKANPDKARQATAAWAKANPEARRIIRQNRRASELENGGTISRCLADLLMSEQGGRCAGCLCDLRETGHHLDHVMPLALGGPNTDENMQLLCPHCNKSKGGKHPLGWMASRGIFDALKCPT
jgi:HNH endonuclease